MKKTILALLIGLSACAGAFAGQVKLPTEHIVLPAVQGDYLICIWDESANDWAGAFASYDHAGSVDFQVPAWGKWYWIGLWDVAGEQYVFGKWIGHFITD